MTNSCRTTCTRPAFTLVELIVAISLVALIAGLAILIVPNLNDQQRAPRGAVMVQQFLMTAKNRALRNRAPCGIRLSYSGTKKIASGVVTVTYNDVTDLQYIEQPDDFAVMPGITNDPSGNPLPFRRIYTTTNLKTVALEPGAATAPDFSGGYGSQAQTLWPVQAGDYLEVNGGLPHRITAIGPSNPANPKIIDQLTLASLLPAAIPQTNPATNYRIIRSPRVAGDEQLQLPDGIAIDLNTNVQFGNTLPLSNSVSASVASTQVTGTIDILFAPSGAVLTRGVATDSIYLWVRDTSLPLFQGDNTLVVIQVRTGAVFAFPVDNTSGNPYSIAQTGRAPQS